MPRNQFQRMVFAFLTVLITVHGYVFYSLYVVNGSTLLFFTGADRRTACHQSAGRRHDVWKISSHLGNYCN